ncbi:hypothetical protein JZK55_14850 [Dissulfurispira thermophila]|uniref:Uncharacterized protein n=2 Tax=root TaxID=1 RepID=A0A7G1H365_9BACT|nr:hypothetical protein [Dissulfurispira thermophila]BCB96563.1 hypothetical protein JZK55_14850 [Dissulfurispira thermophila]
MKYHANVYTLREVKRQGRNDGRGWRWKPWRPFPGWPLWESIDPDPPINQKEYSQYEHTLISAAHENLERIGIEWSKEDEVLMSKYCNAKAEKENLEKKIEQEDNEHKDAIKAFETAKKAFFEFPPRWIPITLYWLIFIAIFMGEGLINYFVFQMLAEEEWKTYVMAGAIIIIIPLSAELLGHFIKKEKKTSVDKIWIVVSFVVVSSLLVGLAVLRETFFEASEVKINMSPTTLAIVLIVFNLAIFTIMTFLSYKEARTDPEVYSKAKREYEEAMKSLKKEGGDVERVAKKLEEAIENFNKAYSEREHTFDRYKHKAEEERDKWVTLIRAYRHANMCARKDRTLPESFKVDPETLIKIPEALEKLDRDCSHKEEANA